MIWYIKLLSALFVNIQVASRLRTACMPACVRQLHGEVVYMLLCVLQAQHDFCRAAVIFSLKYSFADCHV